MKVLVCCSLLGSAICSSTARAGSRPAPTVPRLDAPAGRALIKTLRRGRALGNRRDVFAKAGDSISQSPAFLQGIGCGEWRPGPHGNLRSTVRYFDARTLPGESETCPDSVNSFSRESAATEATQPSAWALAAGASPDPACRPEETPLGCEIRLDRPAYALILFGTNDVSIGLTFHANPLAAYIANMEQIVTTTRQLGVAPVLVTIPPRRDAAAEASTEQLNASLEELATRRRVPLINLWRALEPLKKHGLSSDGLHPSSLGGSDCSQACDPTVCAPTCEAADFSPAGLRHGYNRFNFITLRTLRRLREAGRSWSR